MVEKEKQKRLLKLGFENQADHSKLKHKPMH
jgi:hypothetical protein